MSEIKEIWLPVIGHKGYEVSNIGRVRSIDRWVNYSDGRVGFYRGKIFNTRVGKRGYCYVRLRSKKTNCTVHRLVAQSFLGISDEQQVDHADGNKTNNLLSNLRPCSRSENGANSCIKNNNTSGYKGVHFYRSRKKWTAHIGVNGRTVHLGYFLSKEEAARAYDQAAIKYFGEFARINCV